ncbi:hypothetical protein U0070_023792, partial [Myodes glareolus]
TWHPDLAWVSIAQTRQKPELGIQEQAILCQEHKAALSGLQPSPGSDLGNEGTLGWGVPPFYLLSLQLWGDQQGPGAHTHLSTLHEDTQDGASRARATLARLTRSTFCGASLKVPRRLPLLRALLTCSHSSLNWAKPGARKWRQAGEHLGMRSIMNSAGVNAVEAGKGAHRAKALQRLLQRCGRSELTLCSRSQLSALYNHDSEVSESLLPPSLQERVLQRGGNIASALMPETEMKQRPLARAWEKAPGRGDVPSKRPWSILHHLGEVQEGSAGSPAICCESQERGPYYITKGKAGWVAGPQEDMQLHCPHTD